MPDILEQDLKKSARYLSSHQNTIKSGQNHSRGIRDEISA